jgi:hypothetical protein
MNDDILSEAEEISNNINVEDEVESTENVEHNDLIEITQLGKSLAELDSDILEAEAEVSNLKQKRKHIAEELMPELMNKYGLKLIQLDDGRKIRVDDFVDARIKNPEVAFDWLRDTNNDSIIKNQITVTLGRNEDVKAQAILNTLKREHDVDADAKISVHNMTLKSFCRDALEDPELAESLPREAFGIYQGQRAKIT